jgi:4-amino-4-deoxy-L-arabinose transferase-like glycosyltransferase
VVKNFPKKDSIKTFLARAKATLPRRWFWLLIGLGLIVHGQYLMHQREPIGTANQTLELWNITFRLEIVNIQNFGRAIPYLLGGGLLSALAFLPGWNKHEALQATTKSSEKYARGGENKILLNWPYLLPRLIAVIILFSYLMLRLGQHEYSPLMPWLWLFSLATLTYLLYRHEKENGVDLDPKISRTDLLWMVGLFLVGLGIGSFALLDIPNIMIPDEGSFWETGRAIATGEFKPVFFDFGVYTFPVASSIFQGWVMHLFGVNLWGWRFASVLAGTLTVFPLYLLAREWFDRRVAVMAALFMLSSSYYLSFARIGYNNSQALFPVVLSLYFWTLGYKRNSKLHHWLAGLSAGLGFYTYSAAWLGLVTILMMMVLIIVFRRMRARRALVATTVFLAAVTITAGPRFLYGASSQNAEPLYYKLAETSFISTFYGSAYYGPAELYPEGTAYLLGKNQIFYAPEVYTELLTRGLVRTLAALFDPFIVTEHFITTNLTGGFLPAIGLALGLGLSLRTLKQTRSILLLTWLGAGLLFLSIIAAFPPRHTHLVAITPALALLSAAGFTVSVDALTTVLHNRASQNLINWTQKGILFIVSAVLVFSGLREYFIVMPTRNPQLFEDIVSWIAWRIDEPQILVYIDSTEKTPHRVEYLVNTHMVPHTYDSISAYNFDWQKLPKNSIVFVEPQEDNIHPPPASFENSATYTDREGQIIGQAWANSDVNLHPAPPFPITQGEFPVTIIPFLSGLAIIALVLIAFQIRVTTEKTIGKPGLRIHAEIVLRKWFKKETDIDS